MGYPQSLIETIYQVAHNTGKYKPDELKKQIEGLLDWNYIDLDPATFPSESGEYIVLYRQYRRQDDGIIYINSGYENLPILVTIAEFDHKFKCWILPSIRGKIIAWQYTPEMPEQRK